LRFSTGTLLVAVNGGELVILQGEHGALGFPAAGDHSGHKKISDASGETRKRLSPSKRSAASTSAT